MKSGYFMLIIVSATFLRVSGRPNNHKRVVSYGEKLLSTLSPSTTIATTTPSSVDINIESEKINDINIGVSNSTDSDDLGTFLDNFDTQDYQYDYDYLSYLYDTDYFDLINETLFEAAKNISDLMLEDEITIVNITPNASLVVQNITTLNATIKKERRKLHKPSKIIVSRLRPYRYTTIVPSAMDNTTAANMFTHSSATINNTIGSTHRLSVPVKEIQKEREISIKVNASRTNKTNIRKNIPVYPRGRRISSKVHDPQVLSSTKETQKNFTVEKPPKSNLMMLRLTSLPKKILARKRTTTKNNPRRSQKEKKRKLNRRISRPKIYPTSQGLQNNFSLPASNIAGDNVDSTNIDTTFNKSSVIKNPKQELYPKVSANPENISIATLPNLNKKLSSTLVLVAKNEALPLHERIRKKLNLPLPEPLNKESLSISGQSMIKKAARTSPKIVEEKNIYLSETVSEEPVTSSFEHLPMAKKLISLPLAPTEVKSLPVAKPTTSDTISSLDELNEKKPIFEPVAILNISLAPITAKPSEIKQTLAVSELTQKESTPSSPKLFENESTSASPGSIDKESSSTTLKLVPEPQNKSMSRNVSLQENPNKNHFEKSKGLPVPNFASQLGANPQGTNPRGTAPFGRTPEGVSPFGWAPGGNFATSAKSESPLKTNDTSKPNTQSTEPSIDAKEERFHVQIKKPDGSINGNYVVLDHLTGDLNGVRYDAIDGADQQLIQKALLSFLSLDPRLDPRPKSSDVL